MVADVLACDCRGKINPLVASYAFVVGLYAQCIEDDNRIDAIQRRLCEYSPYRTSNLITDYFDEASRTRVVEGDDEEEREDGHYDEEEDEVDDDEEEG